MLRDGIPCPLLSDTAISNGSPMLRKEAFESPATPKTSDRPTIEKKPKLEEGSPSLGRVSKKERKARSPEPMTTMTVMNNALRPQDQNPQQPHRHIVNIAEHNESQHASTPSETTIKTESGSKTLKKSTLKSSLSTIDRDARGFFVPRESPQDGSGKTDQSMGLFPPTETLATDTLSGNAGTENHHTERKPKQDPTHSLLHRFGKTLRVGASRVKRKLSPKGRSTKHNRHLEISSPVLQTSPHDTSSPEVASDQVTHHASETAIDSAENDHQTPEELQTDVAKVSNAKTTTTIDLPANIAELPGSPFLYCEHDLATFIHGTENEIDTSIIIDMDRVYPDSDSAEPGVPNMDAVTLMPGHKPKYRLRRKQKRHNLSPRSKASASIATSQDQEQVGPAGPMKPFTEGPLRDDEAFLDVVGGEDWTVGSPTPNERASIHLETARGGGQIATEAALQKTKDRTTAENTTHGVKPLPTPPTTPVIGPCSTLMNAMAHTQKETKDPGGDDFAVSSPSSGAVPSTKVPTSTNTSELQELDLMSGDQNDKAEYDDNQGPLFKTKARLRQAMAAEHGSMRRWSGVMTEREYARRGALANRLPLSENLHETVVDQLLSHPNLAPGSKQFTKLLVLQLASQANVIAKLRKRDEAQSGKILALQETVNCLRGKLEDVADLAEGANDWNVMEADYLQNVAKIRNNAQERIGRMRKRKDELDRKFKVAKGDVSDLEDQLADSEERCNKLQDQLGDHQKLVQDLKNETKLRRTLEDHKRSLETRTAYLENTLQAAEELNGEYLQECVDKGEEIDHLKANVGALEQKLTTSESAKIKADEAIDELFRQSQTLEKDVEVLKSVKSRFMDDHSSLEDRIGNSEEVERLRIVIDQQNREITRLHDRNQVSEEELEEELEQSSTIKRQDEFKIANLHRHVQALESELAQTKANSLQPKNQLEDTSCQESCSGQYHVESFVLGPGQPTLLHQLDIRGHHYERVEIDLAYQQGCAQLPITLNPPSEPQSKTIDKDGFDVITANGVPMHCPVPKKGDQVPIEAVLTSKAAALDYASPDVDPTALQLDVYMDPQFADEAKKDVLAERWNVSRAQLDELVEWQPPPPNQYAAWTDHLRLVVLQDRCWTPRGTYASSSKSQLPPIAEIAPVSFVGAPAVNSSKKIAGGRNSSYQARQLPVYKGKEPAHDMIPPVFAAVGNRALPPPPPRVPKPQSKDQELRDGASSGSDAVLSGSSGKKTLPKSTGLSGAQYRPLKGAIGLSKLAPRQPMNPDWSSHGPWNQ